MKTKAITAASFLLLLVGVSWERRGSAYDGEPITFNKQIVRLLQRNCQVCHHPNDIGPFSFMTYNETRIFAVAALDAIESGEMPPWSPSEDCTALDGSRRLTSEEIETFAHWVEAGSPEGDPADLPPPLQFTNDWPLGTPDLVLQADADFAIGLGEDVFRCFSLPTDLRSDRFLSAIDIRPGARSVVHHAMLLLDESGASRPLDAQDPKAGYDCTGGDGFMTSAGIGWWAPGSGARFEPEGAGWRLPKGARLVLQVHYHVHHGGAQQDRTQVGLYFARTPVRKELRVLPIANTDFEIPANDEHYQVNASSQGISRASHAIAIAPHMHLLGKEIHVEAALSDGSTRCLINIDEWDPHFQDAYYFEEALELPANTRLNLSAFYDNSQANDDNPHRPPMTVRAGHTTEDEMCLAFIKYTLDDEDRPVSSPQLGGVNVDSGELILKGQGFPIGADIEIDGKRVADTKNHKKAKKADRILISPGDWRSLMVQGRASTITVLAPDGVRSNAINFVR